MLQDEHGIPLIVLTGSESFEGLLKGSVHQVGIDLRGRDIPVSERPLDHENIGGGRIQVGGEGVAQAVRADSLIDTDRPCEASILRGWPPARETGATRGWRET